MVARRLCILCVIIVLSLCIRLSAAQALVYHLEQEGVKIWINQDGTIDLLYDIIIACDEGELHWVEIGQPNGDFTIGEAFDENNTPLSTSDSSVGSDYKVRVNVVDLNAGESVRFNLTTNVGRMIWQDCQNPGNVGMQFTPTWFPVPISQLQVSIVAPAGVTDSNLKTLIGAPWNNSFLENGQFVFFWQQEDLVPNERYDLGVSFPAEFIQQYESQSCFLKNYGIWIAGIALFGAIAVLVAFVATRKRPYLKPTLKIETLGIRRGLTAVEASHLLEFKPSMIVTEILYSLLKKRVVWVSATKPSVTLQVLEPAKSGRYTTSGGASLRYYEIDFIHAIKDDGRLDEEDLARAISFLSRSVGEKLRGYCRQDTVDYYRKIVARAWEQVEQAGTSELASSAYDEQLLWLLLDPKYRAKTEAAFRNRTFEPGPLWLWYWFGYQHYHASPPSVPQDIPSQSQPPPTLPGAEFADNIATAIESTANNFVANIEKFANAVLPATTPPKTSHKPAHQSSGCVCACAACACACACVSCACACAGGGAG